MARWNELETSPLPYKNRRAAGTLLARSLAEIGALPHPLVLGIPRGGVPVAAEVASQLDGELDVIVARKIGAPAQPELALGAISANGARYWNPDLLVALGLNEQALQRADRKSTV